MNVDEAHFIYTAGLPLYALPAFRPAWGAPNLLGLRLKRNTPIIAMSTTLPPHIKSAVTHFDPATMLSLELSTSCPNIIYATHRIVRSLSDYRSLDFMLGLDAFVLPRKTLVFHDNTQQCSDARAHQNNKLPKSEQNKGLIRHYHAGMSHTYLKNLFDDFSKKDGGCTQQKGCQLAYMCREWRWLSIMEHHEPCRLHMAEPWVYTASLEGVDSLSDDPD
ncbi:hypothetical protein R3P38DRAFT_3235139 [Favolaschia claudopus]|uniref:Uncharacterized protein n=1 Tax=Favolaschia claudopus TaxID=2862362 RepID=A0AAV9ZEF8_9AGAR